MRLMTFTFDGQKKLGLAVGGYAVDLAAGFAAAEARSASGLPLPPTDMRSFLEAGEPALRAAGLVNAFVADGLTGQPNGIFAAPQRALYALGEVRILPPIANPHKMLLLGLNYSEHIAETGARIPSEPVIFAKFDNAIIGPDQAIILPKAAPDYVDLEAELAFVVGRRGKNVPIDEAFDYVAGYTVLNDVSARDRQNALPGLGQKSTQWTIAKSPDTFAPLGPYLVTKDEVPDPHSLNIRSWLNDQPMQDSNTRYLIFNIPFLVHYISQFMTLEPGDIVATGTPSGVGFVRQPPVFLRPGDIVRLEVEGVGILENPVIAEA